MPDLTRRRALLAVASGATVLAGCSGEEDRSAIDYPRDEGSVENYELRRVRNVDGEILFAQDEEVPTVTDDERDLYVRSGRSVIVSDEELNELTFGESDEADRLATFASATDFDASSLYILAMGVEACYEIRLQSVTVEWDSIDSEDLHPHADFCRTYRPADIECEVDEIHTVGFAIRLPVAAEQSSGSGRGMANFCHRSPRGEYFEAEVTPADGGEDE